MSSTRPAYLKDGQRVHETDTGRRLVYRRGRWRRSRFLWRFWRGDGITRPRWKLLP